MNTEEIGNAIKNPEMLQQEHIPELLALCEKHPFAGTFHMLYLKALANAKDTNFEEKLSDFAIKVPDRAALYKLIHDSDALDNDLSKNNSAVAEENANETNQVKLEEKTSHAEELQSEEQTLTSIELDTQDATHPTATEHSPVTEITEAIIDAADKSNVPEEETTVQEPAFTSSTTEAVVKDVEQAIEIEAKPEITEAIIDAADKSNVPEEETTVQEPAFTASTTEAVAKDVERAIEIEAKPEVTEAIIDAADKSNVPEEETTVQEPAFLSTTKEQIEDATIEITTTAADFIEETESIVSIDNDEVLAETSSKIPIFELEDKISSTILDEVNHPEAKDSPEIPIIDFTDHVSNPDIEKIFDEKSPTTEHQTKDFYAWLKPDFSSKESTNASTEAASSSEAKLKEENAKERKEATQNIVNQFIETEPKISKPRKEFFSPVKNAKSSVSESGLPISETLAKIYEAQGNYPKSIEIYEKLIAIIPNKSSYFAARIENIKNQLLE
jgi:tetratricopeptide (TPR) repeat protein